MEGAHSIALPSNATASTSRTPSPDSFGRASEERFGRRTRRFATIATNYPGMGMAYTGGCACMPSDQGQHDDSGLRHAGRADGVDWDGVIFRGRPG